MKFFLILCINVFVLLFLTVSGTNRQFNPHYLGNRSLDGDNSCLLCHVNDGNNLKKDNSPLWNQNKKQIFFETYTSSTMDALPGQPSGTSKLCLTCHDGSMAAVSHGSNGIMPGNLSNSSADLSNDHPISFEYSTALAMSDRGLFDPSSTSSGLGGTIEEDLLENGNMECLSCHNVHFDLADSESNYLRMSNRGSKLCLTCHNK